jgi:outer membrane protein TolC
MNFFRPFSARLVLCLFSFPALLGAEIISFPKKESIEIYFPQISDIITTMDSNSPSLLQNRESVREASFHRMIADSELGITANLNVNSHSIHEKRAGDSYYQRYRAVGSVYVKKHFFHWGALHAKSKIAELSEKLAQDNTRHAKSDLVVHVKSEYLNLVLLTFELKLYKQILQLREQNEEDLRQRNELGLVTELNVSEAAIKKLEQSIKVSELERIIRNRNSNFIFDTGYENPLDLDMSENFRKFYLENDFGEKIPLLLNTLSSNRIGELKNQIAKEEQNLIVANSANKPKLNLIGGFFQDQIDSLDNPNSVRRNNFLIGIEANWNLWDSSRSKGQKSLALAKKRKFDIQLENEIKKLRMEVKNLRRQLDNLSSQIKLSRELMNSAENRLEKSQIELDAKRITPTKHFESEIAMSNANLNLVRTVFTYVQVKLIFEKMLNYPNS